MLGKVISVCLIGLKRLIRTVAFFFPPSRPSGQPFQIFFEVSTYLVETLRGPGILHQLVAKGINRGLYCAKRGGLAAMMFLRFAKCRFRFCMFRYLVLLILSQSRKFGSQ